jgi:hypothetical protein
MSESQRLHKSFGNIDEHPQDGLEFFNGRPHFAIHTEGAIQRAVEDMAADADNLKGLDMRPFESPSPCLAKSDHAETKDGSGLRKEIHKMGLDAHLGDRIDVEDAAKTPLAEHSDAFSGKFQAWSASN